MSLACGSGHLTKSTRIPSQSVENAPICAKVENAPGLKALSLALELFHEPKGEDMSGSFYDLEASTSRRGFYVFYESNANGALVLRKKYLDLVCEKCGKIDVSAALRRKIDQDVIPPGKCDAIESNDNMLIVSAKVQKALRSVPGLKAKFIPLPGASDFAVMYPTQILGPPAGGKKGPVFQPRGTSCKACGRFKQVTFAAKKFSVPGDVVLGAILLECPKRPHLITWIASQAVVDAIKADGLTGWRISKGRFKQEADGSTPKVKRPKASTRKEVVRPKGNRRGLTRIRKYLDGSSSRRRKAMGAVGVETDWMEVCTIQVPSGTLWAGDTGFSWAEAMEGGGCVVDVPKGTYRVEAKGMSFADVRRISRLRACLSRIKTPVLGDEVDSAGTDSGQVGVGDPIALKEAFEAVCGNEVDQALDLLEQQTEPACGIIQPNPKGNATVAFVPSGFGDGTGPVFELVSRGKGRVVGIELEFIPPGTIYE